VPCLGIADMFVEIDYEQRHYRFLKVWDRHCSESPAVGHNLCGSGPGLV